MIQSTRRELQVEIKKLREHRNELERALAAERQKWLSIFDSIDEPVYVADMETYEILYANNAVREEFGFVVGQKCYSVFQGNDYPCDFCTNDCLDQIGDKHMWVFKNQVNGRWYKCIDRAIRWPENKMVRLELAIDITDLKEAHEESEEKVKILTQLVELATDAI